MVVPLHATHDRCLWHVGGTAGENDVAGPGGDGWKRLKGDGVLGNHRLVGKSP